MDDRAECADARDLLPELAMQTAAGDERARALKHLSDCAECRAELAATADAVDDLLALAPQHDPPPGFADAVLARIAAAGAPAASRRWQRAVLWAAAVVALALIAGGTVWWSTADDRRLAAEYQQTLDTAHGESLSAAPLLSRASAEVGTLFAYEGNPSWVYATFRDPPPPGRYDVRLLTTDGKQLPLRPFTPLPGTLAWGSVIEVPVAQVAQVEFRQSGAAIWTARFDRS